MQRRRPDRATGARIGSPRYRRAAAKRAFHLLEAGRITPDEALARLALLEYLDRVAAVVDEPSLRRIPPAPPVRRPPQEPDALWPAAPLSVPPSRLAQQAADEAFRASEAREPLRAVSTRKE